MSAGSILPHTKQHPVWSVRHNCHIPARLWNLRCTPHQIPFHIFCNSFCERCRVVPKHFCFRPPDAVHLYSGLRPLLIFLLFQFCQFVMRRVRFCGETEHFIPVKTIELFRMVYIKRMTQDRFRWIIILLIVKSIHAPEIRDAALGRHTGSAKNTILSDSFTICKNVSILLMLIPSLLWFLLNFLYEWISLV